eukprot:CAMPEP_0203669662 /NCGR_PEP_ID=MMETSP0090-20130426/5962_1 /ASSEMBLY_ACC=CAM_ASM_001088 /TAXON_ID=426623 /ORGANISM="Chaetoceros affinis, Strain CCMP159" /LENGTH=1171 /DNA_ID=CAMNT_0050534389 /DNA_START=203 /DNA_END=3718 /DNA_ORIENTATION=-
MSSTSTPPSYNLVGDVEDGLPVATATVVDSTTATATATATDTDTDTDTGMAKVEEEEEEDGNVEEVTPLAMKEDEEGKEDGRYDLDIKQNDIKQNDINDDDDDDDDDEENNKKDSASTQIITSTREATETTETRRPTTNFFSDDQGNLKFVNAVCKYPWLMFGITISCCIISAFILLKLAIDTGNPFTEQTNAYDIYDDRSIAYDSLRLAKDTVLEMSAISGDSNRSGQQQQQERLQKDLADMTVWIYEAKTDKGLFTKEVIPILRATENTILNHKEYPNYCQLNYDEAVEKSNINTNATTNANITTTTATTTTTTIPCREPLTAMNIFYASKWDATLADSIMKTFDNQENIDLFNSLIYCVVSLPDTLFLPTSTACNLVPAELLTVLNLAWVGIMMGEIGTMTKTWDGKSDTLNEGTIDQVTSFLAYMKQLNYVSRFVDVYLDKNFNISNPVVMYSRSFFYWGKLLNGTKDDDESEDKLSKFVVDNLYTNWTDITSADYNPEVQSYYLMVSVIFDIILQILAVDGAKAFASFIAVFLYLRLMLGSWFLSAVGMFEIFMSVPLSWLVFSYIFQIKYFSALNVLCIFIVIAIGADDIFLFMDAYKHSADKGPEVLSSLETRMSHVYRKSGSAMLLTSVSTCSAFIITTLASPIASTRSFGVFAAFVILFDYILVMTLFCTAVIIYHNHFEGKAGCCNCTFWKRNSPTPTETALQSHEVKLDRISTFFKDKFAPFILKGSNRIIIGVVLFAWMILACIYTSRLQPTTSSEQFLDENHPLQKSATILGEQFPITDEDSTSKIHFIWGLNDVDRDGVNQLFDPEFVGTAEFVDNFSFNEECQTKMLEACKKLRSDPELEEFILRKNGLGSVDCFVEELGAYNALAESATCPMQESRAWESLNWQVSTDDLASTMEGFVKTKTCNEGQRQGVQEYYTNSMGWDGKSLRYAGLSVESSILDSRTRKPEEVVRRHYDAFIKVAEEFDSTMKDVCQSNVIMTDLDQIFVFMNNQRIYSESTISGSFLGIAVAFVVLFVGTRKLHISIFATACILCVLISVIGSITMLGWTLGVIEAILLSILAGFSVDYVIHLAHAYVEAEGDTAKRVKEAFSDMGTSVFSGMLTSVVASIPLFFCTLTFFAKFGTFLCLTIALSWIFANFGFMSLLVTFRVPMDKKCL